MKAKLIIIDAEEIKKARPRACNPECQGIVPTKYKKEKLVLDVPLFLKRFGKRKAAEIDALLKEVDVDDLSVMDLVKLTNFAAPSIEDFLDDYCVLTDAEEKNG